MTLHFTSDLHIGHKNIIKFAERPFRDLDHMHSILANNWNERVSPDDTVYLLGDYAMGPIHESLEFTKRLNGRKVLITGNHDRNFRFGRRSGGLEPHEWDDVYAAAGFDGIYPHLVLWGFDGFPTVNLSHFPYTGDSHDGDRYEEARLQDNGIPLLHGHTHSHDHPVTWNEGRTKKVPLIGNDGKQVVEDKKPQWELIPDPTLQIHVGVDAWEYRPVSQYEIAEIIEQEIGS